MTERGSRVALITGGSRGIGAAAVRVFVEIDYRVAFLYRSSTEAARMLAEETGALAIRADIADRAQVMAAVGEVEAKLGKIDVLVNNAGIAQSKLFTDITLEDWRRMIDVNLSGVFHVTQAVLPGMIARKRGAIINVSSIWGMVGASCEAHYSAAKAGVIGLTKALAKELSPSGITVNCVAPGIIETDMNADLIEADRVDLLYQTPVGRFGTPEEIARLILYFASDDVGFLTGQVISPNGGFVIT